MKQTLTLALISLGYSLTTSAQAIGPNMPAGSAQSLSQQMSPAASQPLSQLRDIHLPPAVGWWPLAPGWWLLATVILLGMGAAIWCWHRRHRRYAYRRAALLEFVQLEQQQYDTSQWLQALQRLLKRTAMSAYPQAPIAGLHGHQWLSFLDRHSHSNNQLFQRGPGHHLLNGPYQPAPELTSNDRQQLQQLVRNWIKRHRQPFTAQPQSSPEQAVEQPLTTELPQTADNTDEKKHA